MQMFRRILATTLAVMLCAPAAWAQQTHVITKSALDQAVQQRVSQDQADRETLRSFLQDPTVKRVAAKAGLSTERAEGALATLQGDDLRQAATQARAVTQDLAGGATVVITTTTIIIILLIVLIIVMVAD
jgi:hypothetical protein